MDNLNLALLSGGYYCCTPAWNAVTRGRDNCYKLYFPVEGSAQLKIDGKWYEIQAGNAYFINGFMLDEHRCSDYMKVYWLHFIPESQFFSMHVNKMSPFYCWERVGTLFEHIDFKRIPLLFDDPESENNKMMITASLNLTCYIISIILLLISDMGARQNPDQAGIPYELYYKLEPSLNFINENYNKPLTLEQISQKSYLNPIYFLRLFKKCFHITPNQYLIMKRLNEACKMLLRSDLSIREIAENTGFCNQFYFSRLFKSHFHKTPKEYRNSRHSP